MVSLSRTIILAAALAVVGGAATSATVNPFGLSLGDNGRTLVTIRDLTRPAIQTGTAITSASRPLSLDSLAYRPQTNQFYGYRRANDTAYLLNRTSGVASPIASTADGVGVAELGFDFNNVLDAARLVSTADDNLVFFPNNTPPNITRVTDLFYGPGDVNAGTDPSVFANAYTNAVPNPATTLQFALDARTDSLTTLANNDGILATIGRIAVDGMPLDFTSTGGFDIFSQREGDNTGYALLSTAGGSGLYLLDLIADADGFVNASLLGATGARFGALDNLAVAPVPLPAAAWLLGAGMLGLGAVARRRRST